jgi:hypothetical protein
MSDYKTKTQTCLISFPSKKGEKNRSWHHFLLWKIPMFLVLKKNSKIRELFKSSVFGPEQTTPPTSAPVGCSVHRMGYIFSSGSWPCSNQHCPTVNLFWLLTLTFFLFAIFFSIDLHTTIPPSYPIDQHLGHTHQLTISSLTYLCIFYSLSKPFHVDKISLFLD